VSPGRPILRVGLTGGIASGKTTVSQILAGHGAFVLDADRLAHAVMAPDGSAYDRIVERFGNEILGDDGRIERPRLAQRVFRDGIDRQALNAIVHPEVLAEAERRIAEYTPRGHSPMVIFDAALLVETGIFRSFQRLVVVHCSAESQLRRLLARGGLSQAEVHSRIAAQAPLEHKLSVADYAIDTEGTLRETREQTDRVYADLVTDFESEFGPPHA